MTTPSDPRAELRRLYRPSARHPAIVDVPELTFLMIDGQGAPESVAYEDALRALYTLAYTLKFTLKKSDAARDFKVMPLEGLWWTGSAAPGMDEVAATRDTWQWTMMIALPPHATAAEVEAARVAAAGRRVLPSLAAIRRKAFHEGLAAQIMHVGPYADEQPTIERLHAFVAEQGYRLRGRHHEIYLGDPQRTAPERLKTILRHPVEIAS